MGAKITEETLGGNILPQPTMYSTMPDGTIVERQPQYNIDVDFILETLEGTVKDEDMFVGHVPSLTKGNSGVTIGFGFVLNYHEKKAEREYNNYLEKLGKIELRKINRDYDNAWYKLPKSSKTILTQNSYLAGNISQFPTLMKSVISDNATKIKEAINLNTKYNDERKKKLLSYVEDSPYQLPEMNIEIKKKPNKPETPPPEMIEKNDDLNTPVTPDDPSITLNRKVEELY
jgi:hypothetical protein